MRRQKRLLTKLGIVLVKGTDLEPETVRPKHVRIALVVCGGILLVALYLVALDFVSNTTPIQMHLYGSDR